MAKLIQFFKDHPVLNQVLHLILSIAVALLIVLLLMVLRKTQVNIVVKGIL